MSLYLHQSRMGVQYLFEIYREEKSEKVSCGGIANGKINGSLLIIAKLDCVKHHRYSQA